MTRILLGLSLAALVLGFMVRRVGFDALLDEFGDVSLPVLGAALLAQVLVVSLKAKRWEIAVRAAVKRPVRSVVSASMIGFAGNLIAPARMGDLARIALVSKRNGVPQSLVLATAGVTQIFDVLVLALYALMVSLWVSGTPLPSRVVIIAIAAVACVAFVMMFAGLRRRRHGESVLVRCIGRYLPIRVRDRLNRLADQFFSGFELLRCGRRTSIVALLTLAVWTLETAAMALGLHAFGVPLSPFLPSLLVVLLALAFAVPITPGNVGPHQFLCVAVLSMFGIAEADALSFSIGFQGCSMAMLLLLGGISLLSEGLTTRQVWSEASNEATALIVASPLVGGAVVDSSPTRGDAT